MRLTKADRATLRSVLADIERAESIAALPRNSERVREIRMYLDAASSELAAYLVIH